MMTRKAAIARIRKVREETIEHLGEGTWTDVLAVAIDALEKLQRRQKLMKRDLIRRAKARKEAAR